MLSQNTEATGQKVRNDIWLSIECRYAITHCILTALGLYETPGPHESHSTLYTVSTLPPWKWGGVQDRITVDWSTNPTVRFCGAEGGSVYKNKLSLVTFLRVHGTCENTAMGTCFSPSTSIWPLNHHSTNAQYLSIIDPKCAIGLITSMSA